MRITFLGTGAGFGSADRSSSGIMLETAGGVVLLDCGPGAVTNTSYAVPSPRDVRAVLLSHVHYDHVLGLWPLFCWAGRAGEPLPDVVGPRGVIDVVSKMYDLVSTHSSQLGLEAAAAGRVWEANVRGAFELLDLRIQARTTQHAPEVHALCYRVDAGGRSVVYSGDATPQFGLFTRLASGVDLLIHEAYSVAELDGASDGASPAQVARRAEAFRRTHTSAADAAEIAATAGAKRLVLTHIPSWNTAEALHREASPHFSGKLIVAYDGLVLDL